jgi:hypothetical protein
VQAACWLLASSWKQESNFFKKKIQKKDKKQHTNLANELNLNTLMFKCFVRNNLDASNDGIILVKERQRVACARRRRRWAICCLILKLVMRITHMNRIMFTINSWWWININYNARWSADAWEELAHGCLWLGCCLLLEGFCYAPKQKRPTFFRSFARSATATAALALISNSLTIPVRISSEKDVWRRRFSAER